jgi:hypothetical protein
MEVSLFLPIFSGIQRAFFSATGDSWQMQVDVSETRSLGFLPADPDASKVEDLKAKARRIENGH